MSELINLNTAHIDYVMTLPGVGPSLAERIVAERPFDSLDDLLRVPGVGPTLLDKIQPLVTLTDDETIQEEGQTERGFILVDDPEPMEEEQIPPWEGSPTYETDPSPEAEEELPADGMDIPPERAIIAIDAEPSEEKPEKEVKYVRRGEVFFIAAVTSLLSFVLAVILTLGTIAILNGGLRFASSAQVAEFTRRLDGLSLEAEIISDDIVELKSDVDQLNNDMSVAVEEITTVTENLDAINSEMERLQANSEAFETFISGLRNLLNDIPEK
jgi:hypothetical protein